jgi:hypothetical protein
MRPVHHFAFAVAVVAGLTLQGTVLAQRSRFGFSTRSSGSLVSIAAEETVQKDIGLSSDICSKLRELQDHMRSTSQKEYAAAGFNYQSFSSLSEEERQKLQAKMADISTRLTADFEPRVKALLTDDEFKRLKQIQLQIQGSDGLTTDELAAALKLTAEQRSKLSELKNEYADKQSALYRSENDQQERSVKLRELGIERDAKAAEILTSKQRTILAELTGPAFDVSVIRSGGRRNN